MGSTRPNLTHMGWVGLGWVGLIWWVVLGWNFFLTHYNGLGQKIFLIRPNPTHAHPWSISLKPKSKHWIIEKIMGWNKSRNWLFE